MTMDDDDDDDDDSDDDDDDDDDDDVVEGDDNDDDDDTRSPAKIDNLAWSGTQRAVSLAGPAGRPHSSVQRRHGHNALWPR